MVKKRELSLCAIIVAICFVVSQSLSVYAVTNSTLTSQQLGTIFDGVESIVVQLDGIGLSDGISESKICKYMGINKNDLKTLLSE